MRMLATPVILAGLISVAMALPVSAQDFEGEAYRSVTFTAIGGSEPVTFPVRQDDRGDDEVLIPDHGWIRCIYNSCETTARNYHFHFWEADRTGQGIGRGILGELIGLD